MFEAYEIILNDIECVSTCLQNIVTENSLLTKSKNERFLWHGNLLFTSCLNCFCSSDNYKCVEAVCVIIIFDLVYLFGTEDHFFITHIFLTASLM